MSATRTETAPLPVLSPSSSGEPVATEEVPLSLAEPAGTPRGGIVVLHEARGVTDDVLGLVRALADEGWLAVAPHLYHREDADPGAEAVATLSGDAVLADCDGAFAWLGRRGVSADRLGVVGFDTGGTVALVVAARRSIGAAVSVSGGGITTGASAGLPALVEVAPSLTCPWLGLYGADDPTIPAAEVELLREAALRSDVATDVVVYAGAGHRLDVPRAVADAGGAADDDALARMLSWFDSHLR